MLVDRRAFDGGNPALTSQVSRHDLAPSNSHVAVRVSHLPEKPLDLVDRTPNARAVAILAPEQPAMRLMRHQREPRAGAVAGAKRLVEILPALEQGANEIHARCRHQQHPKNGMDP
jgi:hypothetical protein